MLHSRAARVLQRSGSEAQMQQLRAQHHKRYSMASPTISQVPDFSKYFPTWPVTELAPFINEVMRAYPRNSKYVNQQHYYHNRKVLVERYLQRQPHAVSLKHLAQYYDDSNRLTKQKVIRSGQFAKEELTVRMAHKLRELQDLPFNVVNNFHFVQVYESYYNIFERFRRFPAIRTLEDNERFAELLHQIMSDFNSLNLPHLIMGALESCILDLYPQDAMDRLMSSFLRARISRRLIVEEHLSVTSNYMSGKSENTLVLGDIFQECSAREYLLHAARTCENAIRDMFYPDIPLPDFIIDGCADLRFYFLPSQLHYLFGETLRNSYEATVKEAIRRGLPKPDPITVTVVQNPESYLFRISDRGGGIPHPDRTIWSFGKSKLLAQQALDNFHKLPGAQTVSLYDHMYDADARRVAAACKLSNTSLQSMAETNLTKGRYKFDFPRPLVGLLERPFRYKLGIGLAMCKVYAEYWNGDLTVHSIHGHGTDTVLKLGNLMYHTDHLQLDRV
ncbi:FAAR157Cp [Eremothecium gossypii FDAG1]|nr:FAAR157Cp [Eremothecium gossypii FDAG1]